MEAKKKNQRWVISIIIGVVGLALITIWAANLKNVWRDSAVRSSQADGRSWEDFREDLNNSLSEIKGVIEQMPTTSLPADDDSRLAPLIASSTESLVDDILQETMSLASSTAASKPAAQERGACPAWVNCMPMVGGPGSAPGACAIPPGCEGITEIAY